MQRRCNNTGIDKEGDMGRRQLRTTGEAASAIVINGNCLSRDALLYYLRQGAPEPERVGGRRMFADEDVDAVREWIIERRKKA